MYNADMQTLPSEIRRAIDYMPAASVLTIEDIAWEQYEQLLGALEDRPDVRVTYDCGRLEIVTTSHLHEFVNEFLLQLTRMTCDRFGLALESYGGATWLRKQDQKGAEADTCFYIGSPERVIGKQTIDLNVDPPPDIVVEVDKANQSFNKFGIYATFRVSEIWRSDVRRRRFQIFALGENSYFEVPSSRFLPILTGDVLLRFIEQSRTEGQTAAIKAFEVWLRRR